MPQEEKKILRLPHIRGDGLRSEHTKVQYEQVTPRMWGKEISKNVSITNRSESAGRQRAIR